MRWSSGKSSTCSTAASSSTRPCPSRPIAGNKYLPLGIGVVVVLQLLFTYAPPLQALFETAAIPLRIWPWLFLAGFVFFLVVELEKFIIRP